MRVLLLVLLAFTTTGAISKFRIGTPRETGQENATGALQQGASNTTATLVVTPLNAASVSQPFHNVVLIAKPTQPRFKFGAVLLHNKSSATYKNPIKLVSDNAQVSSVPLATSPISHLIRGRQQRYNQYQGPRAKELEQESLDNDKNKMFSYSKSMSYSASTGVVPKFSSTEQFTQLPLDVVEGAESGVDAQIEDRRSGKRRSDSKSVKAETKRADCQIMQKPMPNYLHYKGMGSSGIVKPMMTCYVCGKRDEPYSNGGYTEECDFIPANREDVFVNPDRTSLSEKLEDANEPDLFSRASKQRQTLYTRQGQSPYLNRNYGDREKENPGFYDFIGEDGGNNDYHSNDGGNNDYHSNDGGNSKTSSHDGDKDSSERHSEYDDRAGNSQDTSDISCKVVYRGKMKCKVCGNPKLDAIFYEQCDYEKDDAPQHHSKAYEQGTSNENTFRSPLQGHHDGSEENYDVGDHSNGQGGTSDKGSHYKDNDNGGSPKYDDSKLDFRNYDRNSEALHLGLSHEDGDDGIGQHSAASKPASGYKKILDVDGAAMFEEKDNGKKCKVIYKEPPYESPYDSEKTKSKMQCLVCNDGDGYGGNTEECSYGRSGSGSRGSEYPMASTEDSFLVDYYQNYPSGSLESFYGPHDFDGISEAMF